MVELVFSYENSNKFQCIDVIQRMIDNGYVIDDYKKISSYSYLIILEKNTQAFRKDFVKVERMNKFLMKNPNWYVYDLNDRISQMPIYTVYRKLKKNPGKKIRVFDCNPIEIDRDRNERKLEHDMRCFSFLFKNKKMTSIM